MANDAARLVEPWQADVVLRHDWARRAPNLVDSARRDAPATSVAGSRVTLDAPLVGVTHLLAADDALDEQFQYGVYTAVCGQLVPASDLPSWECPEDCGCDLAVYCPQCVCRVAESSAETQLAPGAPETDGRWNYSIGECGHRVPAESGVGGLFFRVGPCRECDEQPAVNDPRPSMIDRTTPNQRSAARKERTSR